MIIGRAPNHLGDGVMALPALQALCTLDHTVIHAPRALFPLFEHLGAVVTPTRSRADAAVLFSPSFRAAWTARDAKRRIGTRTDARGWLLTESVRPRSHRAQTYRALAQVLGATPSLEPCYPRRGVAHPVPAAHVGLNPLTRGGPNRSWTGFSSLAKRLQQPIVIYGGPGEERALQPWMHLGPVVCGLSLPDLAATLQRCRYFVSNDTGPAHFARAVGVPTLVLHLSTSAAHTGAAGALSLHGPRPPCAPCYKNRCANGLVCTAIPVDAVLEQLR